MFKISYILLVVSLLLPGLVLANIGEFDATQLFTASTSVTVFDVNDNVQIEDNSEISDEGSTSKIAVVNEKEENQKEIIVVGRIVRNEAPSKRTNTYTPTIETSADVGNPSELHAFTRSIVKKDENIREVIYSPELLFVSYKQPTKLFGLISFTYTEHVSIKLNQRGDVVNLKLKKPWYMSLISEDSETKLKSKKLTQTVSSEVAITEGDAKDKLAINNIQSTASTSIKNFQHKSIEQKQATLLDTVVEFMSNEN